MLVVASFCNLPAPVATTLLGTDLRSGASEWLPMGAPASTVISATGLCTAGDALCAAWLDVTHACYLSVLDAKTLRPLDLRPLPGVRDVHSICVRGDDVFVVSTGTDTVCRFRLDGPWTSDVVWRASDADADTHHLNAVAATADGLLCSAFGPRTGLRWSTATDGYVVHLDRSEMLCRGLAHPHSVFATAAGHLLVSESRHGRLRTVEEGCWVELAGYTRGVTQVADRHLACAVSRGRRSSRHGHWIENPADEGEAIGGTGLALLAADPAQWPASADVTIDLSSYGAEIYELVAVADARTG